MNCGAEQPAVSGALPGEQIDWSGPVSERAYQQLLIRLEDRVVAEQNASRTADYLGRLQASEYHQTVQRRLEQWAVEWKQKEPSERTSAPKTLRYLIDDLLDFFFIIHSSDLNAVVLPESILQYQHLDYAGVEGSKLALDYLDFAAEEERVYTDFVQLPVRKIRNASKNFLFPEREERIWFICDQSLLGNAKEGFAMTEKALYWKTGFQPAQRVYYHKLFSLRKEKEWLLINDLYYNATPSLNTKMIWLLRRLARWHQANL